MIRNSEAWKLFEKSWNLDGAFIHLKFLGIAQSLRIPDLFFSRYRQAPITRLSNRLVEELEVVSIEIRSLVYVSAFDTLSDSLYTAHTDKVYGFRQLSIFTAFRGLDADDDRPHPLRNARIFRQDGHYTRPPIHVAVNHRRNIIYVYTYLCANARNTDTDVQDAFHLPPSSVYDNCGSTAMTSNCVHRLIN